MGKRCIYFVLIIMLLFLHNANQQYCPQTVFPIVMGGTLADTSFRTLDIDSNFNIALGGLSYDSGVLISGSSVLTPVISVIGPGGDYKWAKSLNLPSHYIQQARFNIAQDKLFLMSGNTPLTIFILSASDGSLISTHQETTATKIAKPSATSRMIVGTGDVLFIGLQDASNRFLGLAFSGSSVIWQYSLNVAGAAFSVAQSSTSKNYVYFGGHSLTSSTKDGVVFRLSSSTGAVSLRQKMTAESFQVESQINMIRVDTFGTTDVVVGASTVVTNFFLTYTYYRNIFMSIDSTTNAIIQTKKIDIPSGYNVCLYIRALSATSYETIYENDSNNQQYYMLINHALSSISMKTITMYSASTFSIYETIYNSNYGIILVGQTNNFGGGPVGIPNQSYSKQLGFVNSWYYNYRCLGSVESTVSFQSIIVSLSVFNAYSGGSLVTQTLTFSLITLTSPLTSNLDTENVSIANCRTLSIYTFSTVADINSEYLIGGGSQSFSPTKFTINCPSVTVTHTITLDTVNSNAATIGQSIETLDNTNFKFFLTSTDRTLNNQIMAFTIQAYISKTRQSVTYTYYVTLKQYKCELVTVSSAVIPDFTYDLRDGDGVGVASINWPQTYHTDCPYTVTIATTKIENSTVVTVLQKVDISSPTQFKLLTQGLTDDGNYQVSVKISVPTVTDYLNGLGATSNILATQSFKIIVPSLCLISQITPLAQTSNITINLFTNYEYQFDEWVRQYLICTNVITFTITQIDIQLSSSSTNTTILGSTPLPIFITFDDTMRKFKFQPTLSSDVGYYYFTISGVDQVSGAVNSYTYKFEVQQTVSPYAVDTTPSYAQYLDLKDTVTYEQLLSSIKIFLSSDLTLEFYDYYTIDISLGKAQIFTQIVDNQIIYYPMIGSADDYELKAIITNIKTNKTKTKKFKLLVKSRDQNPANNGQSINITNSTQTHYLPKNYSKSITARIVSIDNRGMVKIRFNDSLIMPDDNNYDVFSLNRTLQLKV
eukprot:403344455